MIKPTYCVTFPRSGHHWLGRILSRYFGERWHYCESYEQPDLRIDTCPITNIEKTHDFGLDFDPHGRNVIVQCRKNIAHALRSWHGAISPDTPLAEFAREKQDYWLGFLDKWGTGRYPIIWYEDLQANPVRVCSRAIGLLTDENVDHAQLLSAISTEIFWPSLGIGSKDFFSGPVI